MDLDTLTNGGHLEIGGSITVGVFEQHGTLTGINGAALGKVVAGSFYTSVGGVYNDLTVTGTLNNTGADLTLTGEIGTAEKGLSSQPMAAALPSTEPFTPIESTCRTAILQSMMGRSN